MHVLILDWYLVRYYPKIDFHCAIDEQLLVYRNNAYYSHYIVCMVYHDHIFVLIVCMDHMKAVYVSFFLLLKDEVCRGVLKSVLVCCLVTKRVPGEASNSEVAR